MNNRLFTNNAECDKPTSELMARSLLTHAREIYRYAVTYCAPTEDNDYLDKTTRATFVRHLKRMLDNMDGLLSLAREKGVCRHCNLEQIEAFTEAAKEAVSNPTAPVENQILMN